HPARLRQIESERNQARAHLDTTRGRLADNERARRQNEQLLQLEKEKVRKWESRLNELKTPREYAALARELDIAKKTNQTADEEIKRLALEHGELKKQVEAAEQALAEKEAVVAREGAEIKTVLEGVQGRMTSLEAERKRLLEKACAAFPELTGEAAQTVPRGVAQQLQLEKLLLREKSAAAPGLTVRVYADGAARGNPGPAGAGAVLTDAAGNVIARLGRYLGKQTNNVAEYEGLLLGLKHARELGYREVEVRADSQLLIRQRKGENAGRH